MLSSLLFCLTKKYMDGFNREEIAMQEEESHQKWVEMVNVWEKRLLQDWDSQSRWEFLPVNEEEERVMTSTNWMSEVDDVNGVLEGLLTDEVAQAFDKVGIPPHQLILKVTTMYTNHLDVQYFMFS